MKKIIVVSLFLSLNFSAFASEMKIDRTLWGFWTCQLMPSKVSIHISSKKIHNGDGEALIDLTDDVTNDRVAEFESNNHLTRICLYTADQKFSTWVFQLAPDGLWRTATILDDKCAHDFQLENSFEAYICYRD